MTDETSGATVTGAGARATSGAERPSCNTFFTVLVIVVNRSVVLPT